MAENLKIKINDESVGRSDNISKRLSKMLIPAAEKMYFTDPSADILVQKVILPKFIFWKYNIVVNRQTKLYFEQRTDKTFLFINMGEDLKIKFSSQAPGLVKSKQYNVFHTPDFEMTIYPYPSQKTYELILIDIGNGNSENVMSALFETVMNNRRFC